MPTSSLTDYCQADCERKGGTLLKTTCSSVFVLNRRRDCSVLARWLNVVFLTQACFVVGKVPVRNDVLMVCR